MKDSLVVLISGKIGSGKSTFAAMLEKNLGNKCEVMSFAKPLKDFCKAVYSPVTDLINGTIDYDSLRYKNIYTKPENWYEDKIPLTRLLLQITGTDIVRSIDPDFWTKQMAKSIRFSNRSVILVPDWRFKNERSAMENHFSTMSIRVARPGTENGTHVSETELDDFVFNHTVKNQGTLTDLQKLADDITYEIIEASME